MQILLPHSVRSIRSAFFLSLALGLWPLLGSPAVAAPLAASRPALDFDELDRIVAERVKATGVPGASYVVVLDGQSVHLGAAGVASLSTRQAMTPDTAVPVGSLTKAFTALAVLQLAEAGRLELGVPVKRYLPWLELRDRAAAGAITIEQLLEHTSGLTTVDGNRTQSDFSVDAAALRRRVQQLDGVRPSAGPGERWQYSNLNYQILGALIEEVSGEPYERYVTRRILRPLGMDDSFVFDRPEGVVVTVGHRFWLGVPVEVERRVQGRGSVAQGGIVASAEDLGRFLAMMMNGEDDLVSARAKAAMLRTHSRAAEEAQFGFSWHLRQRDGNRIAFHGGEHPGAQALMGMSPASGLGFAVLANANAGFAFGDANAVTASVADSVVRGEVRPMKPRLLRLALFALFALIPLGLVARAALAVRAYRAGRWKSLPRPLTWKPLMTRLVIPTLLLAGLSWTFLVAVPASFGVPLSTAILFNPDAGLLLLAGGVLAGGWAVARAGLLFISRPSVPTGSWSRRGTRRPAKAV